MGQYDRMLAAYDDYEPAFISDTLSPVYAELLYNRAGSASLCSGPSHFLLKGRLHASVPLDYLSENA